MSRSNSPVNSGVDQDLIREIYKEQDEMRKQEDGFNKMMTMLRIPDAVKDLPQYKGDKNGLYDFIQNVEEILAICQPACVNNNSYATIVIRAIRNKIVGDANDVLLMYGTDNVWSQIKHNLIIHYADKRDETSLIRDMYRLQQGNDTIERFFSKIIEIMNTMNNNTKINTPQDNNRTVLVQMKNKLHESMGLSVFLAGLRDPIGGMIRAMRPTTLPEALSFCLKEQNIGYLKGKTSDYSSKPLIPFKPPMRTYQPNNFKPQFNYQQYAFRPYNSQPQYYNHRPFTNINPQNLPRKPFNKPALPPPRQKIEPMDTSSNQNKYTQPTYGQIVRQQNQFNKPFPPRQNYFQNSGPPRFTSQELFNMEQNPDELYLPPEDDYYDHSNEYCTEYYSLEPNEPVHDIIEGNYVQSLDQEIADEDFCLDASKKQSDT